MYNHAPKDYVCPLCQIAKGEPTEKGSAEDSVLFRNDDVTIFVAGRFWRSNPGHAIIIPNTHIENIYDIPEEVGHAVADHAKKTAIALKKAYECDGVSTRQHNEPAGDQDAWHYHLHVMPRYKDDNFYINHEKSYWTTPEERAPYVQKLKPFFS